MSNTVKQTLRDEYNRLKKSVDKILNPKREQSMPQLALQPIRDKRNLRDLNQR